VQKLKLRLIRGLGISIIPSPDRALTSWLDPGALGGRSTLVSDEKSGSVDGELGRVLPSMSSGVVVPDNAVISADFSFRRGLGLTRLYNGHL
jgi:hypothetical protein